MRTFSVGTAIMPKFALGATIGPTLSWLNASYCGFSGAEMRRSDGLALKTTVELKLPTIAWMPPPTRNCSTGL